jgi:hypothetical protein
MRKRTFILNPRNHFHGIRNSVQLFLEWSEVTFIAPHRNRDLTHFLALHDMQSGGAVPARCKEPLNFQQRSIVVLDQHSNRSD